MATQLQSSGVLTDSLEATPFGRGLRLAALALAAGLAAAIPASAQSGGETPHCATTSGSGVITDNGSVLLVGQSLAGTSRSHATIAVVGFAPCTLGSLSNIFLGDCDGDQTITVADHKCFAECMAGPNGIPPLRTCVPMDVNRDGRVDLLDFSRWERGVQPN